MQLGMLNMEQMQVWLGDAECNLQHYYGNANLVHTLLPNRIWT